MQLNDYIGFIFNNASRKLNQFAMSFFKPYDLTPEQAGVIRRLGEQEGISQKELSIRMVKDQTNITRLLDQLAKKKLVRRGPNKEDRRSFLAYLTESGKEMNEKIILIESEIMESVFKGLSEERITLWKEVLEEIAENINAHNNVSANNEMEE
ncbi:MarR family transcriptional regulator [Clostridium estertheticum]|uniref:MarR family winged helix-turn-helix transcriptional regulator n=1 Tax=Clostridium estertheticum TaxID=238834 RepID=UPI0013E8FF19|nr:MarR family transcriptional regulator [Clostridium estertheticum]MBZ9688162.1 MarR family transcriptional regulator [Clostridium estertheticum]